jgi:geranylgeranyl pyrophosphate synthase
MITARAHEMNETRTRIQAEYKRFKAEHPICPGVRGRFFFLLDKRINDRGIRSFFVGALYQYVLEQFKLEGQSVPEHDASVFLTRLPLIAEWIISVQYYQNQILDGKGGLRDERGAVRKDLTDRNLLASHYLKDELYRYIDEEVYPDDVAKNRLVRQTVRRIFQYVDLGQDMQDHHGTIEAFKRKMDRYISVSPEVDAFIDNKLISDFWKIIQKHGAAPDKEWFLRNYLMRMQLTSGALFALLAELVMGLLDYKGPQRNAILKLSMANGLIGQLVNDNNDYADIETLSKTPGDVFADIRNDNVTLPQIFYLSQSPERLENLKDLKREIAFQDQKTAEPQETFNIFNAIFRTGKNLVRASLDLIKRPDLVKTPHKVLKELFPSIQQSIEATREMADWLCNTSPLNHLNPFTELLLDMNSIADSGHNRCYRHIYKNANADSPTTVNPGKEVLNPGKSFVIPDVENKVPGPEESFVIPDVQKEALISEKLLNIPEVHHAVPEPEMDVVRDLAATAVSDAKAQQGGSILSKADRPTDIAKTKNEKSILHRPIRRLRAA